MDDHKSKNLDQYLSLTRTEQSLDANGVRKLLQLSTVEKYSTKKPDAKCLNANDEHKLVYCTLSNTKEKHIQLTLTIVQPIDVETHFLLNRARALFGGM